MGLYHEHRHRTPEPQLYVNQFGDLYQTPGTRAELIRHLHFQRRLVAHLASIIAYINRSRGMSR
jgi:hypothetical protein